MVDHNALREKVALMDAMYELRLASFSVKKSHHHYSSKTGQVFFNKSVGSSVHVCKRTLFFKLIPKLRTLFLESVQMDYFLFVAKLSGLMLNERFVSVVPSLEMVNSLETPNSTMKPEV